MFRCFLIILLFMISIDNNNAQSFRGGIKAGLSTSQVNGDNYGGFNKLGFTGGAYVRRNIKTNQAFQMELNYIQKGSRHIPDLYDYNDYTIALEYVELPILYLYTYKKLRFEAGLAFAVLMSAEEISYFPVNPIPFNKYDFSGIIGLSYPLSERIMFNVRSSNTIVWTPIRSHASGQTTFFNHGQTNVVLEFTLQFTFSHPEDK